MNLIEEIKQLKTERNAVILAHNYVRPELQEIADFTGDSLELSIKAKNVKAETIVFCGVRFMAETAKLLSPDSVVLLPNPDAGCPMADMAAADAVAAYRAAHPEAFLVAYVNTTADVKAHVDLCCTSGNAEKIISELPEGQEVLFLPDRNLGGNMNRKLDCKMDLWPGCCPTHDRVTPEMIAEARAAHPGAKVLVHPECTPEVVAAADQALSTGGILKFVRESSDKAFIIGTVLVTLLSAIPSYYSYVRYYEANPQNPTLGIFSLIMRALGDAFTVGNMTSYTAANASNDGMSRFALSLK